MRNKTIKWMASAVIALCGAAGVEAMDSVESRLTALQSEINQLKAAQASNRSERISQVDQLTSRLEFNALLEIEAFQEKSAGRSAGDLTLAAAELTLDAEITKDISAHVGLLWEEDGTEENNLDEAYIIWGATGEIPCYLSAGKMYLPFGNFESAFISDPLTLELAEIRESAALSGYKNDFVAACAGVFNGDANDDSKLENIVVSVSVTPTKNITLGAYWISDLLESDGLEGIATALPSYEKATGAGGFLNARLGPLAFNAEYVTALSDIDTGAGDIQPAAFNIEASLPVSEKTTVGVKFEGSDEFYADIGADKFADKQYGVVAAYAVNEYLTIAGEYMHAKGLDDNKSGDLATVQFALAF